MNGGPCSDENCFCIIHSVATRDTFGSIRFSAPTENTKYMVILFNCNIESSHQHHSNYHARRDISCTIGGPTHSLEDTQNLKIELARPTFGAMRTAAEAQYYLFNAWQ